ncbi:LD-carboxypeptidase [Candidatus Kapabacteria bacterium]|nr:LD-carboxypeptidase [Candidatus Kapabacteria bacterium]
MKKTTMNRRNFLLASGMGVISAKSLTSNTFKDQQDGLFYSGESNKSKLTKIFPKPLREGSKIAITAPASPISEWQVRGAVRTFKKLGCETVIGDTIKNPKGEYRYFSESEDKRAKELMDFVEDPSIDCILCGRGGYGVMRILNKLDFEKFRKNPKIIIGFSDITALLTSVYNLAGLVTYHGPVASSTFNNFTLENFKKVLFFNQDQNFTFDYPRADIIQSGVATGNLTGGNLKMIVSTLGTPYETDTEDSILFLEDVDEHPYKIDRMLTQLKLAGKLDSVKGFIFGIFKGLNVRKPFYPNNSFTLREVIDQVIVPLGKPVVIGMPIGHIKEKFTMPIGVRARLDTETKSIQFLELPVLA